MPQMAPMDWLIMFYVFFITFIFINNKMLFSPTDSVYENKSQLINTFDSNHQWTW